MKRLSPEEIIALKPNADPGKIRDAEQLAERLKEAGLEGAKYRLATPMTGRQRPATHTGGSGKHEAGSHRHVLGRRH